MSWSPAFREALARNAPRRHRVRTLPPPIGLTDPGLDWTLTADASSVGVVLAGSGSTTGAQLSVPSWQSTVGAWTVDLVGDARPLLARIWRGQLVVHEVSLDGGAWEPVEIGVVEDLRGTDTGRWELVCLEATAALRSRYTTSEREQPLFSLYGLREDQEGGLPPTYGRLAEAYSVGETDLDVYYASAARGDTGIGQGRLVCLGPTTGQRFYVRYTGTSSDTLTGCTDRVYGTTPRYTLSDAYFTTVPFIEDHPSDIVRKILCSTGSTSDTPSAAGNGTYDTLPRTWGYGLPHWLVDHADIDEWKPRLAPATGADDWVMLTEYQQPDALGYLQTWLARAGMWLTVRQGRFTVRGIVDPAGMATASTSAPLAFGRLSGQWVVPGSLRWSAWGGAGSVEYREARVYTATSEDREESTVRSHPSEWSYGVDLRDTIWSNEYAHQRLILDRLAPWVLTLCERLEVDVMHPLARGLAVGDVILLDFRHWGGRDVLTSGGTYDGRAAVVCSVDCDWWSDRPTRLVLATPPPQWWST